VRRCGRYASGLSATRRIGRLPGDDPIGPSASLTETAGTLETDPPEMNFTKKRKSHNDHQKRIFLNRKTQFFDRSEYFTIIMKF